MKRYLSIMIIPVLILVGIVMFVSSPSAHGDVGRVTVVWSPHPDDETLRLSSYTTYAQRRGDILILVAVTDGGASDVKDRFGISAETMMSMRRAEQDEAWSVLTNGTGRTLRLSLPDGAVTLSSVESSFDKVESVARLFNRPIEHYVAATDKDVHPDHKAVALGVLKKASLTRDVVRFSMDPSLTGTAMTYLGSDQNVLEAAHQAYDQIGMYSVPALFEALHNNKHFSRIVFPSTQYFGSGYTRHKKVMPSHIPRSWTPITVP